jgi:ABC-type nitrate/sulfonate/bicarbonate transport system permease component
MELTGQPSAAQVHARAADPAARAGARARRLSAWAQLLIPVGTTIGLLGVWELLARAAVLPEEIPPVTDVVRWLADQIGAGEFWTALVRTVWHWFAGLVLGGVVGIALGLAIGAAPVIHRLVNVLIEFLRPIPAIVYLPLLILVMGSSAQMAIILASIGSIWPMLFQTTYGVRAIDPQAVETGKVFGLSKWQRLRSITFPSLLPYLATGLRIASSLSLIVAVTAEIVGGVPGIGAEIQTAALNGIYDAMYGWLILSGVLGLVLNLALERTERRLLRWHPSHRAVNA